MSPRSIRWLIVGSFGFLLTLMGIVGTLDYQRFERIESEARGLQTESLLALAHSTAIRDAWQESLTLTERRVLQSDEGQRAHVDVDLARNRDDLNRATQQADAAISAADSQRELDTFKISLSAYMRAQDSVLKLAAEPSKHAQAQLAFASELLPEFERGEDAIATVVNATKKQGDESVERTVADTAHARASVVTSLAIAITIGLVSGLGLLLAFNRVSGELSTLVGQVKESGIKVSTSITEIAATSKEQQATATEVAATTTEIGATSREISATSKELVRTMHDVSMSAEQSATLAGTGQQGIAHMEETMRQVIEAAGSVNAKLATLNEKAGDISQVVTTITKVADQTNLLSLNAAIEAEKAGEYGRGFAVVATEIRRLADQTAVATYDIDRMVKAMQSAVSAGVMSMDKFSEEVRRGMAAVRDVGAQLGQVIGQVQALAPRFESVTEGMQAQATGAEQITEALTQLSEAARQTVESLRQSTIAMDDLNQVASSLRSGVTRLAPRAA